MKKYFVCWDRNPTIPSKGITSDDVVGLLKSYGFSRVEIYPRGQTFHVFCYKN